MIHLQEISNDGTDSQFSDSAVDSITVGTVSSGVGYDVVPVFV